jgi:ketosteroid isomerase-like protein
MNVQTLNNELDALVSKGDMITAVKSHFADDVMTIDHDGTVIKGKPGHLAKMEGFLGAIGKVNGITHQASAVNGNISFSEFTFDFKMKDGSTILWHEILRREWDKGRVASEQYFQL